MSKLNPQQQLAVDTINGPILVLAGAGSGKTRVLTNRVAHLIQHNHAAPENILAVTFTNKATQEMKARISLLLDQDQPLPWVGTFHSVCLRILKINAHLLGYFSQFSVYDTSDQLQSIKEVMKRMDLDLKRFNPRAVLSLISSAKSELITPKEYVGYANNIFYEIVAKVYPKYQKNLKDNNAMDFDDLIMQTVLLLENNPAVLEKYQNLFKFILIDEYQDTNHAQYRFTKALASKHKNICVVGDDAQSIYSFRGATIRNIMNFEKDYPDAKTIKLEQNYRSSKKILDASNEIIRLNANQKNKNMWTENPEGESIVIYNALDEKDEAKWISTDISDLINLGVNPDEIAVLYRTNAQSRNIEEYLIRAGITYKIVGNVKFYDRREIKDILSYLRIIFNPTDNLSAKRVINVPRRGIGPKTLADVERTAAESQDSIINYLANATEDDYRNYSKGVKSFSDTINTLRDASVEQGPFELIETILDITGYYEMLNDGSPDNESRLENIKELMSLAQQYSDKAPKEALEDFLDQVALIEDRANREANKEDSVTLMSIHAAKGLEFDHVFVAGMEEGIFPHSRSYTDSNEMEEERRLAYVAITRAKQKLSLTHTDSRTYFGSRNSNPISRFITDIPNHLINLKSYSDSLGSSWDEVPKEKNTWGSFDSDLPDIQLDLKIGDKVRHAVFGKGYVEELNDPIIIVRFLQGKKELSLEYANLEKID